MPPPPAVAFGSVVACAKSGTSLAKGAPVHMAVALTSDGAAVLNPRLLHGAPPITGPAGTITVAREAPEAAATTGAGTTPPFI
mmetsp:Transcript_31872/g.74519  ORF Transcript_31872/g.74519 Transcript_31872/m.74519 type:complete len:83 (+) Transcript_31872:787-1035(+)